jgi:predicted methyltransferase
MFTRRTAAALLLAATTATLLTACGTRPAAPAAAWEAVINSPLRSDDDRKIDARRKPAQFLEFARVRPGMKVLDLVAGGGSTSALVALAVQPGGQVWAQNAKASAKLQERLESTPMAYLRPVVRPFEDPVPPGVNGFDLVVTNLNYHDIVNTPTDRSLMNRRIYDALKPGGYYVIIDNAAKEGSGLADTQTLHRIDEAAVIAEVTQTGFILDGRGDFLRAPSDPREQPFFKMNGQPDDKFALRFVKR